MEYNSTKSNLDAIFIPSQAFVILGHGSEPKVDTFIVPNDCIIVVKAFPGELTYNNALYKFTNKLFNKSRTSIYENPLFYIQELINEFGSLMIYKPGDICPNFKYFFAPKPKELKLKDEKIPEEDVELRYVNSYYGLVPLRDNDSIKLHTIKVQPDIPVRDFVEKLYKYSITPSVEDFRELLGNKYDTYTLKQGINAKTFFPTNTATTQKDLLEIDPITGNAGRPGVYYNFICRYMGPWTNMVYNRNYDYNQSVNKAIIKPNITSYISSSKPIKHILRKRISEAEKRKHFIPGTRFNKSQVAGKRKTRKQKKKRV